MIKTFNTSFTASSSPISSLRNPKRCLINITGKSFMFLRNLLISNKHTFQQECIPVGCAPPASVATTRCGAYLPVGWASTRRPMAGPMPPQTYPGPGTPPPVDRMTHTHTHTPVKTLSSRNFVGGHQYYTTNVLLYHSHVEIIKFCKLKALLIRADQRRIQESLSPIFC